MLVLCRVAALDITKWRVRVDVAVFDQVVERGHVLGFPELVEVAPAKGKGAKVFVDLAEKLSGASSAWRVRTRVHVEALHVVRHLHVVDNERSSRGAKRFDRVQLALLHLCRVAILHNGHGLACVDMVLADRVPVEITDCLDF